MPLSTRPQADPTHITPLRIAVGYAALAGLWIVLSDYIALGSATDA